VDEGLAERIYDEFVCMQQDLLNIVDLHVNVSEHLNLLLRFIEQDLA
jgi:hypothetical protein